MSEKELQREFRALLGEYRLVKSASSPRALAEEVSCVSGRPDILIGPYLLDDWLPERRDVLAAALSVPSDAKVASLLKSRSPRTRDYLRMVAGLDESAFQTSLRRLLDVGIACEVESDRFILAADVPGSQFELWAFEVKLKDMRRASYQAIRNRLFAHRSFIVIPGSYGFKRQRRFLQLQRFGVGVIAVDTCRGTTIDVVRSRRSRPKSRFQQLAAIGRFIRHEKEPILSFD